jgi:hypothetical protein
MKSQYFGRVLLAMILGSSLAVASAATTKEGVRSALKSVTAAEVPARAADLVAQTPAADQAVVTVEAVRIAVKAHPTIAPAIVGSVAKQCPAVAATAAATAAKLQPKQIKLIARAAAVAAPAHAGEIVTALCQALPGDYREIALTVALAVPGAADEILVGLSAGLPTIKAALDSVIASYQGATPSVAAVLDRVAPTTPAVTGSGVRGPTIGPPFIALSGTPTNAPPGTNVPPGGRDYFRP